MRAKQFGSRRKSTGENRGGRARPLSKAELDEWRKTIDRIINPEKRERQEPIWR